MAEKYLTTGIKIKVDATDFETKFNKLAEELNRTLSKSQKALGLQYDANQRLVNSQGQVVEGLSQAQIKLGYYIDELGRVRTYQDEFADGLSRTEQELGFFADALGNVYTRTGLLVRESATVARQNEAIAQSFRATRDAIGDLGSNAAMVFSNLAGASDEANKFALAMFAVGEGVSVFTDVSKYVDEFSAGLKGVTEAAEAASSGVGAFGTATAAMTGPGGWVALGIGALAGLTVGITSFMSQTNSAENVVDELGISFEELRRRAEAAGNEIKSVSDILAAADNLSLAGFGKEAEAVKKLIDLNDRLAEQRAYADSLGGGASFSDDASTLSQGLAYWKVASLEKDLQEQVDVLGEYVLKIKSRLMTTEEKNAAELKFWDELIEAQSMLGASTEQLAELRDLRTRIEEEQNKAQEREAQAAKDNADAENQRAAETRRRLEEERRQQIRNSINFGGLEGALNAAQQENLTFSPETFAQDEARLWDLVNQGIYDSAEASTIISAAWQRNAEAAQKAAADFQKALDEATMEAEREALQNWGFASLQKAAVGAESELIKLGRTFAQVNEDAALWPSLQDEAQTALLGIDKSLALYYDKIAQAASRDALDGKGRDALDKAEAELLQAYKDGKIGEKYYLNAKRELADAYVRESQRIGEARRKENQEKERKEAEAAQREKDAQQANIRREVEDYLDSLKTPWEKYQEQVATYEKQFKDGIIESRDDLNVLLDKAWNQYLEKAPVMELPITATWDNDAFARKTDSANRRDAGAGSASVGSAELYKMQLTQANDRQAQMLASLDATQTIIRDSFSMLNNLVLSIRQNLESDVNNRQAAVFRGLAAQTVRNYGG